MGFWKNWSLQTKMILTFTIILSFTIAASGGLYYYNSVRNMKNQTVSLIDTNITQMTRTVELYMQDMERLSFSIFGDPVVQSVLRTTASSESEQNQLNNKIESQLLSLSSAWSSIQGVYIFANTHKLYYLSKGTSPEYGYSMENEPWFSHLDQINNSSFYLWPTGTKHASLNKGEKVFSLIRVINDIPTGKKLAYLEINLNVKVMKSLLAYGQKENDKQQAQKLFLVTDAGNVIYANEGDWTGQKVDAFAAAQLIPQNGSSGEIYWNGTRYLYNLEKSTYTHWTTLVLTPLDNMKQAAITMRNLVLAIGAIAIIIALIISFLFSIRITIPLRKMMKTMRTVEKGDFSIRVSHDGRLDEIGQLGFMFNHMLESLQRSIKQVYESQIRQKDSQLLALQAQINPHFLFNTLNMMKALSRSRGVPEITETAESLAELFRYSMDDWSRPVRIRDELTHVENYIKIQKLRFGERFMLLSTIPDELQDLKILKLSIQPLVENAVVHGLEQMETGGIIQISAKQLLDKIEITVADNGAGMNEQLLQGIERMLQNNEEDALPSHSQKYAGIGILNIQQRLQLMYGTEFGLSIASVLNQGTRVTMLIPGTASEEVTA